MVEVHLPVGVIRIGRAFDFDVTHDGYLGGQVETVVLPVDFTVKDPVASSHGAEIPLFDPAIGFAGMSAFSPTSEHVEDGIVYGAEDLLANHMAMILCPASDDRVELQDQFAGWGLLVGLQNFLDFGEEGLDILLRWLD